MSIKKEIEYSLLTDKVYIGRQNKEKGIWIGEKEDITQDFLHVSFQYFKEDTIRTIGSKDKKNLFINIKNNKKSIGNAIKNLTKRLNKL